jgi:cysteine desulfurase
MPNIIYMDNNATTRVDPLVFDEMRPYFCDLYGNPSSMHTFGGQVGSKLADARSQVAAILGCKDTEVIFTSCGTESDSTAIRSALESQPEKRHIISTKVEHPAVLNLTNHLVKKGYHLTLLSVDEAGMIDLGELRDSLRDDTALVSIMWANNETGTIFPIEEIAGIVHARGALFHTDAVQAVGKIPLDMSKLPIDFLALSGHKLHAPKGIGALYIRKGVPFRPFLLGGHQERGRRGGTEAVPSIIALGKACEIAQENIGHENTVVKALRDRLEEGLVAAISNTLLNGHKTERLPNTLNLSFKNIEGEGILLYMNEYGICASSGSACTSGSLEPSHVLRAMGVPYTFAHGSIRFSLSRFNTADEVELVIRELPPIIERLRAMSPYVDD